MNTYLIGYSGHAFVVAESALAAGINLGGYFENEEKKLNPYHLAFMGKENSVSEDLRKNFRFFISIGSNSIRENIFCSLNVNFCNIIDPTSVVSPTAKLGNGIYIGKQTCINALSIIGNGAIINTAAVVEHECTVGEFAHIAPGAVLCGNVSVGKGSFVGANSVVRPGISIGNNVTIGAGSVVVKNIPDNSRAYGNPIQIKKC
jgi:UDP-N-acetylbacillosamine N-acetyltransferase